MSNQAKYQVKYRITAVIGVAVTADSHEKAVEKAKTVIKKDLFVTGVESIDEKMEYVGFDNLSLWDLE